MGTSSISSKANASDVYTKTKMNNALSAKNDQSATYTETEVYNTVSTTSNKSDLAIVIGGKANASHVYTKGQVDGMIQNLFYRIMAFYDDNTGTKRGVIPHPATLHFAFTKSVNPTGAPIIMTMSRWV